MFSKEDIEKLKNLGNIALFHINKNDKRVANAICEAFDILKKQLEADSGHKELQKVFYRNFGMNFADSFDALVISCYNTAQYFRALEACELAEKFKLLPYTQIAEERRSFTDIWGNLKKPNNC